MKRLITLILAFYLIPYLSDAQKSDSTYKNDYLTQSVLWYKYSGEMQALYYQAYNIARLRLDGLIKTQTVKKKAIVLDLDETVINNSDLYSKIALRKDNETEFTWKQWTDMASADTVPGAVDFLNYAYKKGFAIFYITNRDDNEFNSTLTNLRKFKIPYADSLHLICKSEKSSSKESRRMSVAKNYNIVLLFGDNLNDFSDMFYNSPDIKTNDAVRKLRDEFGKKFIVFPNPMYGYWEDRFYKGKNMNESQRKDARRAALKVPF